MALLLVLLQGQQVIALGARAKLAPQTELTCMHPREQQPHCHTSPQSLVVCPRTCLLWRYKPDFVDWCGSKIVLPVDASRSVLPLVSTLASTPSDTASCSNPTLDDAPIGSAGPLAAETVPPLVMLAFSSKLQDELILPVVLIYCC